MTSDNLLRDAIAFHQKGYVSQAEPLYLKILQSDPGNDTASHLLGLIRLVQGRAAEALSLFDKVLANNPNAPAVLLSRADALAHLGRGDESLACYDVLVAAERDHVDAWYNRGNLLRNLGRLGEALASYDKALGIRPGDAEALYNRGITLSDLGRFDEALGSFDKAVSARPGHAATFNNRGNTLQRLKRYDEAVASFDRALAIDPNRADAWNNRGNALRAMKNYAGAVASLDRALALRPDYAEAWANRAGLLWNMKRTDEALASFEKAISIRPDFAAAFHSRGMMLWGMGSYEAGLRDIERAVSLDPDIDYARGALLHFQMSLGDWRGYEREKSLIAAGVRAGRRIAEPFAYMGLSDSPAEMFSSAKILALDRYPAGTPRWRQSKRTHTRIRIGYLSADFREQATAYLAAGLYELHDKAKFEIVALDNGWNDKSAMRERLAVAFDKIIDISGLSDDAAADRIAAEEIDILVNLNGYFGEHRMGVFAQKPAPIQVNFLGFPGTLGADYMDYILADRIVIPEDGRRYYTEQVVYLPDSYQVNDSRRAAPGALPSRADHGLPETGFVFCSFNQSYKLTPEMFDVWMRLLQNVEGSVLWLLESKPQFPANLRREAERHGIAGERIIFAPAIPLPEHLARLPLADLFLDCAPCNAHTTASDALWAGLPLITCIGNAFAGRVAASLLHAVDMPDLVCENLESYEALALNLARDAAKLKFIRDKLSAARASARLFNTGRFRKAIEFAYAKMWESHARGGAPQGFSVPPPPEHLAPERKPL